MKSTNWEIVLSDIADRERDLAQNLEVEFPLYMQLYREALGAVLSHIDNNQELYSVHSLINGSVETRLAESNIFAFIGERGTGKTTVISEFCRILQRFNQNWEKWIQELGPQTECRHGEKYRFYVMEPIDGSVLEAKEDLLEVILAAMYDICQKKFQYGRDTSGTDLVMNHNMQAIGKQFDEVYKAYINMRSRKDQDILGESSLVKLMNTSSSLKVREGIHELVKEFLALLDGTERESSYLVVTIDDLDLNLENGYDMLEQLQKYLADRKVIVLVAIRYEQLQMICEKHVVDSLVPKYGAVHLDIFDRFAVEARKISNDYLLKALPLTNRIYMPERKLMDKKGEIIFKNGTKESIKHFILKEVALHTNIYYDIKGVKKHFCLPNTVRELVNYKEFLDTLFLMEEIEAKKTKQQKNTLFLYDQNHERFNRDIEDRMAVQILDYEQQKLFRRIRERDLGRRAKYAINFLNSWIENKKRREKEERPGQKLYLNDYVDEQEYCFSDFLEALYGLGRTYYDDKPVVHCLLASFTSEMVREYYNYRYNDNEDKKDSPRIKSIEYLGEFLGKTFGGKWFGEVMPGIRIGEIAGEKIKNNVAYLPDANLISMQFLIEPKQEPDGNDEIKSLIESLAGYIPYIECLSLCLSDFTDKSGKTTSCRWQFDLKSGVTEIGQTWQLDMKNSADIATFDIFGFIGKELTGWGDGEEGIDNLCNALTEEMCGCFGQYLEKSSAKLGKRKKETYLKELREQIKKKSIWCIDNKTKDGLEREVAFPFYEVDLAYNIMKRVRRSIKTNKSLENMGIYDYFRTVYDYIGEELENERDEYKKLITDMPDFYSYFVSSPYIKALKNLNQKKFDVLWGDMIRGLNANHSVNMTGQDM